MIKLSSPLPNACSVLLFFIFFFIFLREKREKKNSKEEEDVAAIGGISSILPHLLLISSLSSLCPLLSLSSIIITSAFSPPLFFISLYSSFGFCLTPSFSPVCRHHHLILSRLPYSLFNSLYITKTTQSNPISISNTHGCQQVHYHAAKKQHPKIMILLVYTLLEWTLITLLLCNGFCSILIAKFVLFFVLKPPSLLFLSRHLFGTPKCYIDFICDDHPKQISRLGYCSAQMNLADASDMCEDCASSRPLETTDRTIAVLFWMKRSEQERRI